MERIFIGVLCLSGCLTFATCLLHQYHFVSDAMNWTEAQSYCRERYTDLATIENAEEKKKLCDIVRDGQSSEVWIGLYSHIDWKWSDGFNESGAEYRNWNDSEPINFKASQRCVRMKRNGKWLDRQCQKNRTFVCNGTFKDPEFVLVETPKNWSEAQKHCREHHTDLATVRSVTDNDKISKLINTPKVAWIGLHRDPQIYWSDGSNYAFKSWSEGSNRHGSMKVLCGVADLKKKGNWRLIPCEEKKTFVCYSMYRWCFLE